MASRDPIDRTKQAAEALEAAEMAMRLSTMDEHNARSGDGGLYQALFGGGLMATVASHHKWRLRVMILRREASGEGGLTEAVDETYRLMQQTLNAEDVERAIDILGLRRVPLISLAASAPLSMVRDYVEVAGIAGEAGIPGAMGEEEMVSAQQAFGHAWCAHFAERIIRSPKRRDRYRREPERIRDDFAAFADAWARDFGRVLVPSKACLAYCRSIFDGMWKRRAYGESVTTLFLERFRLEIAWARRARFHFGVDRLQERGRFAQVYAADINRDLAEMRPGATVHHVSAVETAESLLVAEISTRLAEARASGRTEDPQLWATHGVPWPILAGLASGRRDIGAMVDEAVDPDGRLPRPDTRHDGLASPSDAAPGIVAHVFLEKAYINLDQTFMAMLAAFIESESGRSRLPLLRHHHPAFSVSVRTDGDRGLALERKAAAIEARRSGSVEHLEAYQRFGWFHCGMMRLVPYRLYNQMARSASLPSTISDIALPGDVRKARRRLHPARQRQRLRRRREAEAARNGAILDVVARLGIMNFDCAASDMVTSAWGDAALVSPTVRAARFCFALKRRPAFMRTPYVKAMDQRDIAIRCLGLSEVGDIMAGLIMPEAMNRIVRRHRSDYLCGYAAYGQAGIGPVDAAYSAMRALHRRLNAESCYLAAVDYTRSAEACAQGRHWPGNARDKALVSRMMARDPFMVPDYMEMDGEVLPLAGRPAGSETADLALRMPHRKILDSCHGLMMDVSEFRFKDGVRNPAVFQAWQDDIAATGRVTSRNFALSYLLYVIRHATWSGRSWDVMTGRSRRSAGNLAALFAPAD